MVGGGARVDRYNDKSDGCPRVIFVGGNGNARVSRNRSAHAVIARADEPAEITHTPGSLGNRQSGCGPIGIINQTLVGVAVFALQPPKVIAIHADAHRLFN